MATETLLNGNQGLDTARPTLENGDRLSQAEFHRLYEQMPPDFRAELLGGVVYVPSPHRRQHGTHLLRLGNLFLQFADGTPGVEAGASVTIILGEEDEPQPDLYLRVLPDKGGQSWTTEDDYLAGPPELLAEVASTARAIDLHLKRARYQETGVVEYVVWCVQEQQLLWYHLGSSRQIKADGEGIFRSKVFPGLWIDGAALAASRAPKLRDVLRAGLTSPAHERFAAKLQRPRNQRKHG
jgi:Uma2 family endonuclease